MRVLILSDVGLGPGGGVGVYCGIIRDINVKAGNETIIANLESSAPPFVKAFWDKTRENYLKNLIKNFKVDIVHVNILNPNSAWLLSKIIRKLDILSVFTIHTLLRI